MGYFKQKFRDTKKLPDWIFVLLAGFLRFMRFCFYRVKVVDPDGLIGSSRGVVGVTWHNRLLFFPAVFPKEVRKCTVAVVSASRDGQYIADLIKCFGLRSARGSSSKGGAQAQLEASRALKAGNHVSFTPDGPRGPRYRMSKGPIHLASMHQAPIVPVTVNASRYWECKSWDRFQIPKPFSTLTVVIGTPIPVPADSLQWNPTPAERPVLSAHSRKERDTAPPGGCEYTNADKADQRATRFRLCRPPEFVRPRRTKPPEGCLGRRAARIFRL